MRTRHSLIEARDVVRTLHHSPLARVEELNCSGSRSSGETGYSPRFHLVFPRVGSFVMEEGRKQVLAGSNDILLVPEGREYRIHHPVEGDRSLVIFPRTACLDDAVTLLRADLLNSEVRLATPAAQMIARQLLWATAASMGPVALDELVIDLWREIGGIAPMDAARAARGSLGTIRRAKEFLHANVRTPIQLTQIAEAAGVNSIYLTQLFRRSVGIPVHQYLIQLRLAEALDELPHSRDLTALALDLGFSSHSHFSSTFRSRYGHTPSRVRTRALPARAGSALATMPTRPLCRARGGTEYSTAA